MNYSDFSNSLLEPHISYKKHLNIHEQGRYEQD